LAGKGFVMRFASTGQPAAGCPRSCGFPRSKSDLLHRPSLNTARGQGQLDHDADLRLVDRGHLAAVDEAELDDVDRELGVVAGLQRLPDQIAHIVTATSAGIGVAAGQSLSEPVMFLERPAPVDAQAASDALLLHLPKQAVFGVIGRNPKFARRVIAGLSQRIEGLVRDLDRQALGSGRERFIAYLLRHGRSASWPFVVRLPVAKAELASQLNLTAEHFSRVLHELAHSGLLSIQGRQIMVTDRARLEGVMHPH
jgi:CRP-like cAMP-binding protein